VVWGWRCGPAGPPADYPERAAPEPPSADARRAILRAAAAFSVAAAVAGATLLYTRVR
jgi:hypothetical protein